MEAPDSMNRLLRAATVREAGQKALEFRAQGYHCSESVFLAINDTFRIADPCLVKAVSGFHGGGGTHRLQPAAGTGPAAEAEEVPVEKVQHLCGALAAGLVCISLVYGRCAPEADLTCVDELCFELHRRFQEELGHNECKFIREIWAARSEDGSCAPVYRCGAEIVADILLGAHELAPECRPVSAKGG